MSGQTNSTSNLLVFNLPIDLFTEATEKKWMPVIKKNRMVYHLKLVNKLLNLVKK